jgi:hypothetical protein
VHHNIEGNWNHFKAIAEQQWTRLAEGLEVLAGRRPRPAAKPAQAGEIVKQAEGADRPPDLLR